MTRVLVTDAHLAAATAVIRSLGRRGDHVIAAGSERWSPGFRSRYAAETLRYPAPADDPDAAVRLLLRTIEERRVDLLIPVTDDMIIALSPRRHLVPDHCAVALPSADALAVARDKAATLELARRLAVPTPRTWVVREAAEVAVVASELRWPVVVKPHVSRVQIDGGSIVKLEVAYAQRPEDLERRVAEAQFAGPVLLQEYCEGEAVGVEMLLDHGRPLAAFQHRRLREVPITGGASSFRESMALDPALYEFSARLLGELGWTGLAMVEYKVGSRGPRLMEVNGRVWGSLALPVKAGMDFPARLADLYVSGPPASGGVATDYELGVRSRNLELDVVWVSSVLRHKRRYPFLPTPRRRDALRVGLGWLAPGDGFDVLTADDPRPAATELVRIGAKLRSKLGDDR